MQKSDASKATIEQIPNIGYKGNSYLTSRMVHVLLQDKKWLELGVNLGPFDENIKYRSAQFPQGWSYYSNPEDPFHRSGYYIDPYGEKLVRVFMKDADYQTGVRVEFICQIASV